MKRQDITFVVFAATLVVVGVMVAAQSQDRFTLKSANGIAFSEFRDYEAWQMIATSQPLASAAGLRVLQDGGNAIGKMQREKPQQPAGPEPFRHVSQERLRLIHLAQVSTEDAAKKDGTWQAALLTSVAETMPDDGPHCRMSKA